MDRRGFLRGLGALVGVTAAGIVLPEPERVRRFWQVGRNAPVGGPVLVSDTVPLTFDAKGLEEALARSNNAYERYIDESCRRMKEAFDRREEMRMFGAWEPMPGQYVRIVGIDPGPERPALVIGSVDHATKTITLRGA